MRRAEPGAAFSSSGESAFLASDATESGRAADEDFRVEEGVHNIPPVLPLLLPAPLLPLLPPGVLNFVALPPTGLNFFKPPGLSILAGEYNNQGYLNLI